MGTLAPTGDLGKPVMAQPRARWNDPAMPNAKQSYKITYPNGKIYVGMDLTGSLLYVGTPSARQQIADDLDAHRFDLTLRKQIHWESETATDAEVRVMEAKLAQTIPRLGATDRLSYRPASTCDS